MYGHLNKHEAGVDIPPANHPSQKELAAVKKELEDKLKVLRELEASKTALEVKVFTF